MSIRNYVTTPLNAEEQIILRVNHKKELKEMIAEWRSRIEKALLSVENRRRNEKHQPYYPENVPVKIPQGPNADLWLLNLRVWCLRYCVSPEFVIETLTRKMKYLRKIPYDEIIALGISASTLGGAKARQFVEDEVFLQYPNGENLKIAIIPEPPLVRIRPHDTPDQMVRNYSHAIEDAQRKHQHKIRLMTHIPTRPYRQSPKENV